MESSTEAKDVFGADPAKDTDSEKLSSENSDSEEQAPTIEERFASLDQIIEKMDAEDVPLEEAFSLYQSGLEQVKAANDMLDSMEKALLMMNESGDLEDFE